MADRPDYRALGETFALDAYDPELPPGMSVAALPPYGDRAPAPVTRRPLADAPAISKPWSPPVDFRLLDLSRNPRLAADYATPVPGLGGTLGVGADFSPLAPLSRSTVSPSFRARYRKEF